MVTVYRELPPPKSLGHLAACLWEQESAEQFEQWIVPDGCVDLIWLAERQLVVAGPDTRPHGVPLPAQRRSSGIRLHPGAAGPVLGLPASELRNQLVKFQDVWPATADELATKLTGATPMNRMKLLAEAVSLREARPDSLVVAAVQSLALPGARVAHVAAELGVTERTLHRRILAAVGYGPKTLARVSRLNRLKALPAAPLAILAAQAGYASQAHMSDEVRHLTGRTAVRFLEDSMPATA